MSKSTKIIAGLGVAAALGVAALPMASFAANYSALVPVEATVANSVKIEVQDMNADTPAWVAAQQADASGTNAFADLETIDFGSAIAPGAGVTKADQTEIRVTTNFPAGYTIGAVTTDLEQAIGNSASASIADFATATAVSASGNTTSGWGINVQKNASDYVLGSATTYIGSNGTFETVSDITGQTVNTYVANYGLNVSNTQAAGTYSGSVTYTVASDATLDPGV